MLEGYTGFFSRLRTDRGLDRYPAITNHRAPHKPFLLLSVMDLIAEGQITKNFIEPSYELTEDRGQRSEISNRRNELDSLEQLRMVLIGTYFAPEIRPVLIKQGMVNVVAYQYSLDLFKKVEAVEHPGEWLNGEEPEVASFARNQGFRKAIVQLYDHRCSLCGIRILTPEGHTVVEAAHIRPWNESRDDRPTNGLALCRLCHWSFDEGLMGVGQGYEVLVSRRVRTDQNMPGHMLTLMDRSIFRPSDQPFWPDQENLGYHRRQTFKN